MSRSIERRGTTVIELLVACALLLFLMGCLYTLLVTGLHYFQQARAYQDVQQQSLVGLRSVLSELQDSRPGSWSYATAPVPHLIFLSASLENTVGPIQHDPASAEVQWQKWVCFRLTGGKLERTELVITPTINPPALPAYGSFTFAGAGSRPVAHDIQSFFVEAGDTPYSVFVEVTSRVATGSGPNKYTELKLRSQVFLYNRY